MTRMKIRMSFAKFPFVFVILCPSSLIGQTASAKPQLPEAPQVALVALAQQNATPMQQGFGDVSVTKAEVAVSGQRPRLTQSDAEKLAIKNNPRVSVARLLALAQHQIVRETRSAELPTGTVNITAEDAEDASRVSAGSLTASRLFKHAGAGGGFTQLITDFGRTSNLVASSKLQEKAQNANALASTEDIVLAADQAFFNALQAQALLKVAEQNVSTRQTTETQISELTKNKLKSTLDLSFADVNLSQARLLLLDAQNNVDMTMAALDAVLGIDHEVTYDLVDSDETLQAPPTDADQLLQLAFQQRPDLQALTYSQQAAVKFSHAQRDQMLPSINAAGTVGSVPIRPAAYYLTNWWGGIGVNMNIPIFNGFLYSAQAKEASIRAQAASEQSRELRDRIVRDVRTAWLAANTAYQRVAVTAELLKEANLALQLAQTRYQLGLSSIVELSQAQFQQTDAAIGNTDAQYQYRLALATINYEIGANP
jgi:outer membrane protein